MGLGCVGPSNVRREAIECWGRERKGCMIKEGRSVGYVGISHI